MKNDELLKKSLDDYDLEERERYLKEISGSLHRYMKTGVTNSQLDIWLEHEEEFKKSYSEHYNLETIEQQLNVACKRALMSNVSYLSEDSIVKSSENTDRSFAPKEVEHFADQVGGIVTQTIRETISKVLNDAVYLSHMNMLYELYEQEYRQKIENRRYEKILKQYAKISEITDCISKKRRVRLEDLEKQSQVPYAEICIILDNESSLFNIRKKDEGAEISLSPLGKKFHHFLCYWQKAYSGDTLNQLVYKNCNSMLEALEKSKRKGIGCDFTCEGLTTDKERAIKNRYYSLIKEYVAVNDDMYHNIKDMESKVKVNDNYEKAVFRIGNRW